VNRNPTAATQPSTLIPSPLYCKADQQPDITSSTLPVKTGEPIGKSPSDGKNLVLVIVSRVTRGDDLSNIRYVSHMSARGLKPLGSKPESLTDMVFEAIRDAIVSKALPPGSQVSEASLAAQLSVSKTPVRETLLRLRHAGLVEPDGRSLRVILPSPDVIRDAYELRSGLEQAAVRLAAERATDAERTRILDCAESSLDAARVGRSAEFHSRDHDFHLAIAEATHNPLLARAVEDVLLLTSALRARDVPATGDSVECGREHVGIAEALRDGDDATAARRVGEHLQHVLTIVLAGLQAAPAG
jgi:DNA-binding GntR family transcriptional regulator